MGALEIDDAVRTFLRIKNGDEYTITKVIDDDVYRRRCHELRTALGGTRGLIRDKKRSALAQFRYSIPVDEFDALLMAGDPDALAWSMDKNDKRALHRLVQRYPHWRVCA